LYADKVNVAKSESKRAIDERRIMEAKYLQEKEGEMLKIKTDAINEMHKKSKASSL